MRRGLITCMCALCTGAPLAAETVIGVLIDGPWE